MTHSTPVTQLIGLSSSAAILLKSDSPVSFSADLHECLSGHWGTSVVLSTAQTQGNLQGIDVKTVSGQAVSPLTKVYRHRLTSTSQGSLRSIHRFL